MSTRAFSIPSLTAVGLSLTTGCAEPLIGTWDFTEYKVTSEGESYTYELPYVYTYTYEGDTYTYTTTLQWQVADDLTGGWTFSSTEDTPDGSSSSSETYAAAVTKSAKATYDIAIADLDFTGSCSVADTLLACSGQITNDDGPDAELEIKATLAE